MIKFEEICSAFDKAQQGWFVYQNKCFKSMTLLVQKFIEYCRIPNDDRRFRPLNKKPDENSTYSILGRQCGS